MKILNLYSGLGGNRKLWGNDHEIVSIEYDQDIAKVYTDHFPKDTVTVTDAHEFLREHYYQFDFIWSSPPCQTHSSFRQNIGVRYRGVEPKYPDMRLYQEILFLQANFDGLWVVENVKPYYKPLIEPTTTLQRHLFWSNFEIKDAFFKKEKIRSAQIPDLQKIHGYDLSEYSLKNKRQVLRNCVSPEIGNHILNQALSNGKQS